MSVISVSNLSKFYRLGTIGGGTIREDFGRWWAKVRGRPDPSLKIGQEKDSRQHGEEFWALRDVSFEVRQGEILGIIGRNGAGKSTILKILSRVTAPTSGELRVKGRIASLLEVGTGFHPELTGRENVFLNGAILGMSKAEIRSKFDEIVAFSGVEAFIDTPVKRYSSGMYVRLAFAVAAHLEPEILIVDEVLAVGDAEFQKKCMNKMQQVSSDDGRTIVFVSHNMTAVRNLCSTIALMESGRCLGIYPSDIAVDKYLQTFEARTDSPTATLSTCLRREHSWGTTVRIDSIALATLDGIPRKDFKFGEAFKITLKLVSKEHIDGIIIGFSIKNNDGSIVFTSHWNDNGESRSVQVGETVAECHVQPNLLCPANFLIDVGAVDASMKSCFDLVEDAISFSIVDLPSRGVSPPDKRAGLISLRLSWNVTNEITSSIDRPQAQAPWQRPPEVAEVASNPYGNRQIDFRDFEVSERLFPAFPNLVSHNAPSGNDDLHFQDLELQGAIACTPAEATLLHLAAGYCSPKAPLEIGSYIGWSSAHIASAISSTLTCVDPFIESGSDLREETSEPAKQRFRDNLERAGLSSKVRLVCKRSPEALRSAAPSEGWDFAFVDGWHVDGQPIKDVAGLLPYLSTSAVVFLHDLWIADVRDALCYLRTAGWDYSILNTSNYLTIAWTARPDWMDRFLAVANEPRFVNASATGRTRKLINGLTHESIDAVSTTLREHSIVTHKS